MKKFIYTLIIGMTMFIGINGVGALDYKDMNERMMNAISGTWDTSTEISDGEGSYYKVKVLVGNINEDSDLNEIYKDVGKKMLGSITVYACENENSCPGSDNWNYIKFNLKKADSDGNIYVTAYGINDKVFEEVSNSKYHFISTTTNGAWINGDYNSTKIITNNAIVEDNRNNTLGSYENPYIINGSGSFTIDYESYKYYYKIIIPDGKYGRYKVIPDSIGNGISTRIVGNNYSETTLCTDEDEQSIVYYSDELYYIELNDSKKLLNQTITFTYLDDDKTKICGGTIAKDPTITKDDKINAKPVTDGETIKLVQQIYNIIKILIPVLIIALSVVDFFKVILISDDKNYKSAWDKFIKRLIIGIIFFLVPIIVSFILKYSGIETEQSYLEIFK